MQWPQWLDATASIVTVATAAIAALVYLRGRVGRLIARWREHRRFAKEVEQDYIRLFGRKPD